MSNSNWNRTFMTAKQPGKKAKNRRTKKTKFFLALLILMALGIGNLPAHAATTLTTVDNEGKVGRYTSLALNGSGFPVISYYDSTNFDLKVAVCNDATCTSPPTLTTVDNGRDVGVDTSLALNSRGFPVISYYDYTNGDLKVAVCNDETCTSPTLTTVGDVGWYTSLALNSDKPVISYYDNTNKDLKVAVCNDEKCTSPTLTTVDNSLGDVGKYTSLALNSDKPVISYYDNTNYNLKVAVCNDATCTSPTLTTVDNSVGDVGFYTSLALNSDKPVISYNDNTNGDLKVAVITPPTVTSLTRATGAANPTNASSVDFTVTFSEDVTGVDTSDFTVRANGATGTVSAVSGSGKSYNVTVTTTSDGSLGLDVKTSGTGIQSSAGNALAGGYTNGEAYTIDKTGPVTTLTSTSKPTDPSNVATASFEFNSDESTATFECQLDTGGWAACNSPHALSGLADGSHTFEVRAKDTLGNTDATPESYTWTVDTTGPVTTLTSTSKPTNPSNVATASFEFNSDESTATFECQLNTGGWAVCPSPQTLSSLADGSHTFEVRAKDTLGNTDATPESYTWTVDTTAPSTTLTSTSKPTNPSNVATASFEFSSDDSTATFECKLDTGGWAVCTSQHTLSGLADGSHTFEVRAKDAAGNVDATPESYTWTITTVYVAPSPTATATASATPSPTASPTPSPTSAASTGKPKLQIGIRGPKQVSRGQAARFTLTYSNTGSVTATEVVIKLPLPPYTTFDKANSTPGWALTKTVSLQAGQLMATGSVTATSETYALAVGDLTPGQSGSATFATTVQADAPADLTLNVEASIGDSTSTGSTALAKSSTAVEVAGYSIYLPLILR